jgi:hypothetical protein
MNISLMFWKEFGSIWQNRSWRFWLASASPAASLTNKHYAAKVIAWFERRNKNNAKANWQFKTHDASIKIKYLYPVI